MKKITISIMPFLQLLSINPKTAKFSFSLKMNPTIRYNLFKENGKNSTSLNITLTSIELRNHNKNNSK